MRRRLGCQSVARASAGKAARPLGSFPVDTTLARLFMLAERIGMLGAWDVGL